MALLFKSLLSKPLLSKWDQLQDKTAAVADRIVWLVSKHGEKLLRLGILLAAPVAAAGLGYIAGKLDPLYALAAATLPLALLAMDFILRHFELFPLLILATGIFVPLSLPTGTGSRLVFSLVFTALFSGLWILKMLLEKRFWLYPEPTNIPLIGFMAATAFALLWSNLMRDPAVITWRSFPFVQLASTLVMIMLPAVFLMVGNLIKNIRLLKILVGVFLIASVLGLIRFYFGLRLPVNTNGMFGMWGIALSFSFGMFYSKLPKWARIGLLTLTGAWVTWGFILHISWLAGWLPGFVAIGVITFMRSKKLVLLAIIGMIAIVLSNPSYYLGRVLEDESEESGVTRVAAWEVNWRVTSQHWLFGTGPAGYAAYYMSYFPTEGTATHSNYIDLLAQTGVVGFSLCAWFFIALGWQGYRLALRLKGRGDFEEGLANAALAGTAACIVIMAFGDWLFPFAYTQSISGFDYAMYNWVFMGTIPVLDRLTRIDSEHQNIPSSS